MTDELNRSQALEISRLNQELAQARQEAKKYRLGRRSATEELATTRSERERLTQERDAFKVRLDAAPSDLQKEVDRLRGELRTRDHKQVFERLARDSKVRPEALNDLWQLAALKVDTDVVDEEGLTHAIHEAVSARPYLLAQDAPEPPKQLSVGSSYGRGGDPGRGKMVVTEANLADPRWVYDNKDRMAEATRDGNVVIR